MPSNKYTPFDTHHERYEAWYEHHQATYCSELLAVRSLLPLYGLGIEIGVGTGRFAAPLGVRVGIEPSRLMLANAVKRGILCARGIAEYLPFKKASLDYALIVTTICFVDDPESMLAETYRILKPGTPLIVGFVDRESTLGKHYLAHKEENTFYRHAKFYSAEEVENLMREAGFSKFTWGNTLTRPPKEIKEIEPFYTGRGHGSFVVVRGLKT